MAFQVKELGPMKGKKKKKSYRFLVNLGKHVLTVTELLKWIRVPDEEVGVACLKIGKLGLGGYTHDPNMKYVM